MFARSAFRSALMTAAASAATTGPLRHEARADGPSAALWGNFPNEVANEIRIFAPRGIRTLAVAPNMGFALVTVDRRFVMRNVPPLFAQRLEVAEQSGREVWCVAFGAEGG